MKGKIETNKLMIENKNIEIQVFRLLKITLDLDNDKVKVLSSLMM